MRQLSIVFLALVLSVGCRPGDADSDGFEDDDCDDTEASVFPGAEELCDGLDNDCDGELSADEQDADGDGFTGCDGDCDDADAAVNPSADEVCGGADEDCDGEIDESDASDAATFYTDADGDGFGLDADSITACALPDGAATDGGDCDDADPEVNPSATEVCGGGDEDCDGEVDEGDASDAATFYTDADGDGFGLESAPVTACSLPDNASEDAGDCDDANNTVNPSATEVCGGADEDCDGETDEADATGSVVYYTDADGDGFGLDSAPVTACALPSGAAADGGDCNDADQAVNPGAVEVCGGTDEDCDGTVDEADASDASTFYTDGDADGFGVTSSPVRACTLPTGTAQANGDCDDTDAATNPAADEVCGGGDEDCDGQVDESEATDATTYYTDGDADGYGVTSSPVKACERPTGAALANGDCDDTNAAVSPGKAEVCGGADEDCDGEVDEDDASDAETFYVDADGDDYGVSSNPVKACALPSGAAESAGDCNDDDASINPEGTEVCDGADNDCSGSADDGLSFQDYWQDNDGDGWGDATTVESLCERVDPFVQNDEDCDDSDATISPDGNDATCDGIDQDCTGADSCGGFSTDWVEQEGTIGQFTRCESVTGGGYTCNNPEIRYGNVVGGIPYEHGGNRFNLWCQQLGFADSQSVQYGSRNCNAPRGKLFGCTGYDESTWHWCDWQDGDWYNESLDNHGCTSRAITSITCRD